MNRYDTDLWRFLKGHDEKSFTLSDRLKVAQKFLRKLKEIKTKKYNHRDLKPSNVLLNLTPEGKWNGQMEITDFGISDHRKSNGKRAGICGWAKTEQFTDGRNSDEFAARLLVFMILLSWNTAWWFIWDGTATVNLANPVEKLFSECRLSNQIPNLLSKISSLVGSQNFRDEWALYCRSTTANIEVDSNTQKSINVDLLRSKINLDEIVFVTNGTKMHKQEFSNLCHSFSIVTSFRRELCNVMEGKNKAIVSNGGNMEAMEVLDKDVKCSFSNFLIQFVTGISPRSLHGLAGQNWNQQELSAQFCDLEKGIKRLVYPTRAFGWEGWKRMNGVDRFFSVFRHPSFHADFELSYCKAGHPNSATNVRFYPTARNLNIFASPPQLPATTFDAELSQNHYVIVRDFRDEVSK